MLQKMLAANSGKLPILIFTRQRAVYGFPMAKACGEDLKINFVTSKRAKNNSHFAAIS